MVDFEISDLSTRLRQVQEQIELLAAQQYELRHQLQTAETARDRRRQSLAQPTD